MAKKRSKRNPLDPLRPIKPMRDRKKMQVSTKYRIIGVTLLCLALITVTFVLGQNIKPINTVFGYVAAPFQKAYLAVEDWFSGLMTTAKRLKSLDEDNEKLQAEIDRYMYENTILKNDAAKLEELQELYELDNYYENYPKTGAQIVSLSPSNWYDVFIIDKGSKDGLQKYMPVLAGNGLVGHISEVFENYSRVTAIVNPDSFVYGEVNRSPRDKVGVQGLDDVSNSDLCRITFTTDDVDIAIGDEIVTSALGEIYPPGLRIGTVLKIQEIGDGLNSEAYLEPAVDMKNLNYVLVITELWKDQMKDELEGSGE